MSPTFAPMGKRQVLGLVSIGLIWVLVLAIIYFVYPTVMNWENLELLAQNLKNSLQQQPIFFTLSFFCFYAFVNMVSIPIATILALCGGALYGNFWGTLMLSVASDLGGCGTFLVSRFLMRQIFERRLSDRIKILQQAWQGDGSRLLISLRLQPVFPYILVNILFGLSRMPLGRFAFWSFFALMPNIFLMVNAGQKISTIRSPQDIYRIDLVLSLALLAIFPWIIEKLIQKKTGPKVEG